MDGTIFNIQHYTIHDGPGIRTEVFLKGCPLNCPWCSNPEGQKPELQVGVFKSKCLSDEVCGLCAGACTQEGALVFSDGKLDWIDDSLCTGCMACVDSCPADAIKQWGSRVTVDEVMKEIIADRGFYERSGGGVTVSGGEPLLQADFVAELFKACKAEGIHTCCESTLVVEWDEIEKVLPWTDLFITDIKHMDSEVHRSFSGLGNERIFENQRRLALAGKDIICRMPVIPGVNDDDENVRAMAEYINGELGGFDKDAMNGRPAGGLGGSTGGGLGGRVKSLQLLSFMRLGEEKYESLGRPYAMKDVEIDREKFQERVAEIAEYFNSQGIHCTVGSREKE